MFQEGFLDILKIIVINDKQIITGRKQTITSEAKVSLIIQSLCDKQIETTPDTICKHSFKNF